MLVLERENSPGEEYAIVQGQVLTIGRAGTNVIIKGDTSVSRNHAEIEVGNGGVLVKDPKSKFGTYVGEAAIASSNGQSQEDRLGADEQRLLKPGERVRFGLLSSIFKLKEVNHIVSTSCVPKDQVDLVKNVIKRVDPVGVFTSAWSKNITHMVVKEGKLTIKVSNSLANGVPIVTVDYFKDLQNCVNSKQILPNVKNYVPSIKEASINSSSLSLAPDNRRKTVFNGKLFVFANAGQKDKYQEAIECAGGKTVVASTPAFRPKTLYKNKTNESNIILISASSATMAAESQSSSDDGNSSSAGLGNSKWSEVMEIAKSRGCHPSAETGIVLAILEASCDNHCNPKKPSKVLPSQRSFRRSTTPRTTLAPESESLVAAPSTSLGLDSQVKVIPETARASTVSSVVSVDNVDNVAVKKELVCSDTPMDPPKFSSTQKMDTEINSLLKDDLDDLSFNMPSFKRPASPPAANIGRTGGEAKKRRTGASPKTSIDSQRKSIPETPPDPDPDPEQPVEVKEEPVDAGEVWDNLGFTSDESMSSSQEKSSKRKRSEDKTVDSDKQSKRLKEAETKATVTSSKVEVADIPEEDLDKTFMKLQVRPLVVKKKEPLSNNNNANANFTSSSSSGSNRNVKRFRKQLINMPNSSILCKKPPPASGKKKENRLAADRSRIADKTVDDVDNNDFFRVENPDDSLASSSGDPFQRQLQERQQQATNRLSRQNRSKSSRMDTGASALPSEELDFGSDMG